MYEYGHSRHYEQVHVFTYVYRLLLLLLLGMPLHADVEVAAEIRNRTHATQSVLNTSSTSSSPYCRYFCTVKEIPSVQLLAVQLLFYQRPRLAYIVPPQINYGHTRSRKRRQPAAAKPFLCFNRITCFFVCTYSMHVLSCFYSFIYFSFLFLLLCY